MASYLNPFSQGRITQGRCANCGSTHSAQEAYLNEIDSTYNSTATNSAWNHWVAIVGADGTYTSTSSDNTWNVWVTTSGDSSTTTCSGSATNTAWTYWVNKYGHQYAAPAPRTPEQIAQIAADQEVTRQRVEEARKRAEEMAKQQQAATKRALQLLRDHLTEKQRKDMAQRKFFLVQGGKTGKTYRIHTDRGISGNIEELAANDNKKAVARYCVHAPYNLVPDGDNFLTQKLMLELDEETLLQKANRTQLAA